MKFCYPFKVLVFKVCGELAMEEEDNRRFLQTFVLCPQTPKKYYVHNNLFEWLDRAFHDLQVNGEFCICSL